MSRKQQHERLEALRRGRLYNEFRLCLNESDSKWLKFGVKPAPTCPTQWVFNFSTEISLCGSKAKPLIIGDINDFYSLLDALWGSGLFGYAEKAAYYKDWKTHDDPEGFGNNDTYRGGSSSSFVVEKTTLVSFDGSQVVKIYKKGIEDNTIFLARTSVARLLDIVPELRRIDALLDPTGVSRQFQHYLDKAVGTPSLTEAMSLIHLIDDEADRGFIYETACNFNKFFMELVDMARVGPLA